MAEVILLSRERPGAMELNLMKIVRFMGGSVRLVELTGEMAGRPQSIESLLPRGACVIASAGTLAALAGEGQDGAGLTALKALLGARPANVLVCGFGANSEHSRVLRGLTGDALTGVDVVPASGHRINVSGENRAVCGSLTGISFEAVGPAEQPVFVEAAGQGGFSSIVALGDRPFFIGRKGQGVRMFLLAGDGIADLDARVAEGRSVLEFFATLAPVLMFLRGVSRTEFWHNDRPGACFIVDDPLLRRRYGFLDFQKLLELMEQKRFTTSIAFIPWNHRRSQARVAQLLADHPGAYSLCIHGCDHTRGEFGGADRAALREKAQRALEWMQSHRQTSGVGFDEVMVFPQGIFSTEAMSALQSCGYLAAVNSTACPVDGDRALTLGDLLQVAVTRFSNFPLFTRRYPQKMAELAFDLFLGKPALLVEHHGFFRDGYDALVEAVEKVQAMDHRLEWTNLHSVCSRACLEKYLDNGEVRVQFYTNRFFLRNDAEYPRKYVLQRRTVGSEPRPALIVDGRAAEISHEPDRLTFELLLNPGQSARINLAFGGPEPRVLPARRDRWYEAKVFVRRSLSEFRDNFLDVNPFVSRAVRNRRA